MKTKLRTRLLLLFTVKMIFLTSCSRYVDQTNHVSTSHSGHCEFIFWRDSNRLIYKSNVMLRADAEIYPPKNFTTYLPKKLKGYQYNEDEYFAFFYPHNQVIAIFFNPTTINIQADTIYIPTRDIIHRYIDGYGIYNSFELRKIEYISNRRHLITRRSDVVVLFYNIKRGNLSEYLHSLQKLKLLNEGADHILKDSSDQSVYSRTSNACKIWSSCHQKPTPSTNYPPPYFSLK